METTETPLNPPLTFTFCVPPLETSTTACTCLCMYMFYLYMQIDALKSYHEECRQQHAFELREYARLVDIKAARIKNLKAS